MTFLDKQEFERVSHNGIMCDLRPNTTDRQVWQDNIIKQPILRHVKIASGDNWLDLGAYIGTFALFVMHNRCRVFSVEALTANAERYRANLKLNEFSKGRFELRNAVVVHAAPKSGILPLHLTSRRVGEYQAFAATTLYTRWKRPHPVVETPAVSFRDVVEEATGRFGNRQWNLKLDIEGAELEILEADDLSMFKQIYFEYHLHGDPSWARATRILKRLKSCGMQVHTSRRIPTEGRADNYRQMVFLGWAIR